MSASDPVAEAFKSGGFLGAGETDANESLSFAGSAENFRRDDAVRCYAGRVHRASRYESPRRRTWLVPAAAQESSLRASAGVYAARTDASKSCFIRPT